MVDVRPSDLVDLKTGTVMDLILSLGRLRVLPLKSYMAGPARLTLRKLWVVAFEAVRTRRLTVNILLRLARANGTRNSELVASCIIPLPHGLIELLARHMVLVLVVLVACRTALVPFGLCILRRIMISCGLPGARKLRNWYMVVTFRGRMALYTVSRIRLGIRAMCILVLPVELVTLDLLMMKTLLTILG